MMIFTSTSGSGLSAEKRSLSRKNYACMDFISLKKVNFLLNLVNILIAATYLLSPGIVFAQSTSRETVSQKADLMERAGKYRRPYGANAPWNIPVGDLDWHPDSRYYSGLLWRKAPNRRGNFNLSFDTYTYPVYLVSDATGVITARIEWDGNLDGVQIPWNPSWKPAPGKDAQVIVLDETRGHEWNLFKVRVRGSTLHAKNGNLVPGDYRSRTKGYPPSRGIGIPYLAMLVRPEEIALGRIEHALSMPISNPSGIYYVSPATKLEKATGKEGIPEGMRFALDITEAEIQVWLAQQSDMKPATKRSALIIARALRDYGWFITDIAGSASFQFEANVSARNDWKLLGLGKSGSNSRVLPRDLLDGLITEDRIYAIVSSNNYR